MNIEDLKEGDKVEAMCGACDELHVWTLVQQVKPGRVTMQREWEDVGCKCARQTGDVDLVRRKLAEASRYDPFGEMGHIVAVSPAEAVEAYTKAVEYAGDVGRVSTYPGGTKAWTVELARRNRLVDEAAHCVLLSGFAARGDQ